MFVFVSVNVSVETPFTATGFGENPFAIVGLTALVQPVNVISSKSTEAASLFAPVPVMRMSVLPPVLVRPVRLAE